MEVNHPRSKVELAVPATTTTSVVTRATLPPSVAGAATARPGGPCRNSSNTDCGPFSWDPAPDPDQPLTVKVTRAPAAPRAGEAFTFTVVVEDPDVRSPGNSTTDGDYGDGVVDEAPVSPVSCGEAFGSWTPPVKVPDRFETTFQHVYSAVGIYTAWFAFESTSGSIGGDPYSSRATGSVTVNVAP